MNQKYNNQILSKFNNMNEITIEDFLKGDLRVAKIESCELIEDAKKLLKLTLDLGNLGKKTVFAGIKKAYLPEELIGKLVICVANLKPREMSFGTSEAMILAAGDDENGIFLLSIDSGATEGMKVR